MEVSANRRATLYGLSAVLMWSTVATGFKLGLAHMSVSQLLLLGTFFSWLVFVGYALLQRQWRLPARDLALAALLGAINPFLYYWVLFAAYDRLPAHIAQPLNYTWAITLALLAVPILKQRLTARSLGGILLSYAGVVVLLVGGTGESAEGLSVSGVLMALGSTVLWALYWLMNTRSTAPAGLLMLWSFTFALPTVALLCALTDGWPAITLPHIGFGVWVGAVEMGLAFICWQRALRLTDNVGRVGQLIFLSPFLSLLVIYHVLGEAIGASAILGLVIIVAGLVITQRGASTPGTRLP